METIGKRLSYIIEIQKTNPNKISLGTKIHASTIKNYITDQGKPDNLKLDIIADFLNIDRNWLREGIGDFEIKKDTSNGIKVDFSQLNIMLVPLVNKYAYAGYLNGYGDDEYIEELPKIPFADDIEHKGDYLCFEVKGDSMDDDTSESYLEGDILLCRSVRHDFWKSKLHINKWDFVIVHKTDGILIKRIIKHDVENGELILHSLNDFYEDKTVYLKDIMQIFNVVDIRRKRNRR